MPLVRIIRALDGMLFALLALALLALYPAVGRNLLGQYDMFCVLPAFVMAWCALGLPGELQGLPAWPVTVRRVRVSLLCFAGLTPFSVWWLREPADSYLLTNAILNLVAGAAATFYLVSLSEQLCRRLGQEALAWEARLTRNMVFWLMFVVGLGGVAAFMTLALLFFTASNPGDMLAQFVGLVDLPLELGDRVSSRVPGLVTIFLVLAPMIFVVSLLVRLRYALLHALGEKLGEEP